MAKIGMEYVVSAQLTETAEGTASYSDGRYWGPASTFNLTTNANDVTDYGDDRVVETDKTLNSMGVSVELNESTLELEAELLGHTLSTKSGSEPATMEVKSSDIAPYFGVGCVGKSRRNNTTVFRGIFLAKVQFANPSDDNTTKQESTSFNHTTFEGTAYPLVDGTMSMKAEFATLAEAKAWLNKKVGITE